MTPTTTARSLKLALRLFGLLFVLGVYPLTVVWPAGWTWHPAQPAYLQMILGIYATLGVFLIRAADAPEQHQSLIWFTVWSSVVHAGIMAVHAIADPAERAHLAGDVAALLVVAGALGVLLHRHLAESSRVPSTLQSPAVVASETV
jgi:hypothetical protein